MHFVVDTVSEFTYFQNLLLGLADALNKCVGVKRTYLRKTIPLTNSEISDWEEEEGVSLPDDLRSFYSSSNGYMFEWTYTFGDGTPKESVVGRIEVNSLEKLRRVYGYETTNESGITVCKGRFVLRLSLESKLFELSLIPERGRIVLVYLYPNYEPSIWLLMSNMKFYFLADNITLYLRMSIVHLGIPLWQLAYTPEGVPQWTENMFRMLLPSFNTFGKTLEKMKKARRLKKDNDFPEVPLNKLDPNLFTILPRAVTPVSQKVVAPPPVVSVPEKPKVTKRKPIFSPIQTRRECCVRSPVKYKRKPLYYIKKQ
ncbi:hypothetical protein ILUMI_26609 [Ignelater luminosus]|uniref:Knr4/Smi1-like domain-containing protein n=1 Tax=Ignelater luminosus TaxID=2038154 RepID=A0A8K0C3M1_IGNLU|nr:hypothetical protein ILUMI_26609 [Ignelater luminosus]